MLRRSLYHQLIKRYSTLNPRLSGFQNARVVGMMLAHPLYESYWLRRKMLSHLNPPLSR